MQMIDAWQAVFLDLLHLYKNNCVNAPQSVQDKDERNGPLLSTRLLCRAGSTIFRWLSVFGGALMTICSLES